MKKSNHKDMKFAGVWLPKDLHKKAREMARADDRSLSVFMRRLIEKAVSQNELQAE